MTPISRRMPSREPRSIFTTRLPESGLAPITRAAIMGVSAWAVRKLSSAVSRSASSARPSSSALRTFSRSSSARMASFSFCALRKPMYPPQPCAAPLIVQEPIRCRGEISSTAHTRISRTCRSRLICTASSSTCVTTTVASSVRDLCREGIAIIGEDCQLSRFLLPIRIGAPRRSSKNSIDRDETQQPEIAQHLARSEHHRRQRIVGNRNRQTGLLADALVQILEQRASPGKHDPAVADVGGKLGRGAFESHAASVQNRGDTFGKRLANFAVINRDCARHALNQVAPFHFHGQGFFQWIRRSDLHLDLLRRALSHKQVVFPLQVLHDGFVHFISR